MKKAVFVLMLFMFSIMGKQMVYAQAGEAAVPFLLIAPGARNGGMGEAGVALVNDATAAYWNPAGLAYQYENPELDNRNQITLMHAKWLPQFNFSDLYYDYGAARFYVEDIGMLGASITYLNLGKNEYRDENNADLGTFQSFEYAVALSYATLLKPNLSIGVNAKLIQSNLAPSNVKVGQETGEGTATSFAVDVGVLWYPQYSIFDNRLALGANLANFGPAVTYIDKKQADPLPTNLRMGLAYTVFDDDFNKIKVIYDTNRLLVYRDKDEGADGVLEAVFYSSWVKGSIEDRLKRFTHSIGMEYSYGGLIALRTGYFYEDESAGDRKFLTFGAGIGFNIFDIDFSYISASEDHPLSDTMRFSLGVGF
ncbi:MAG: type IX secretion system outer membrane channel protein PorV [Caldithrix sp.]|nr:type IX secretion system outer membrane channel protein PorV [Caldithrix sp.]